MDYLDQALEMKPDADRFKKQGKINWVADLSQIPNQYQVYNV